MRATKKGVHLATSVTNTQQRGLGAKKKNPEVIAWGKKIYRGFSKTVPYNYVTEFPHNISIIKAIVMLRPLFKNSILWSNNVWNWFDSEEGKLVFERFGYNRYVSRKTVSSRHKWLCEHVIPLKFLSFFIFLFRVRVFLFKRKETRLVVVLGGSKDEAEILSYFIQLSVFK